MSPRMYGSCGSIPATTGVPLPSGVITHREAPAPGRHEWPDPTPEPGPAPEPMDEPKVRDDIPPRTCLICGHDFYCRTSERVTNFRRRTCCSTSCAMAQRLKTKRGSP